MFTLFEKLVNPFPPEPPGQPPKTLLAFCYYYTRDIKWQLVAMALLTGLLGIIEVSLFGFLGQLVDWLSEKNPETFLAEEGMTLLWIGLLIVVALPLIVFAHSAIIHQTLQGNYPMIIRWQAHRYLLGQSLSFFQNEFAGRIATKVLQTALSIRETVMKTLDVLLFVAVYFTGITLLIAGSDYRLAIPLIIWLLFYLSLLYFFIPRLRDISAKQADARSLMTGRIVDSYTNINTVKLFSHSKRESDYAKNSMQLFLKTVYPQMRMVTQLQTTVWSANALLIFSLVWLSIYLWMQSSVNLGAIAIAMSAALRLNGMSQWIMWEVASLFENIGTVQDGMNTLSRKQDIVDDAKAENITIQRGAIEFSHVSFHYGKGSGVIDDFSLSIKPGEKVGLIGRSGAGKSTLVNLLLRFHDVEAGKITIDGQNVTTVTQDSLRAAIGMVAQDTSLLHRSVKDNILYGKPDASEADIIAAAEQAEAHAFIQGLSDASGRKGYDAHVGEHGVKLSGGQRQRIAIARVLLKDAPILVLDEATSALDSEIEAAIQENLYRLMSGKTVIAIAHRLSTVAAMDRLIVVDQGKIIEQGSHDQLIDHGGIYAQLWRHQSGGFLGRE